MKNEIETNKIVHLPTWILGPPFNLNFYQFPSFKIDTKICKSSLKWGDDTMNYYYI